MAVLIVVILPILSYFISVQGEVYQLNIINTLTDKGKLNFTELDTSFTNLDSLFGKVHIAHVRFVEHKDNDEFISKLSKEVNREDAFYVSSWRLDNVNKVDHDGINIGEFVIRDKDQILNFFKMDKDSIKDNFFVLFNSDMHLVDFNNLDSKEEKDQFVKQISYLMPSRRNPKFRNNRK